MAYPSKRSQSITSRRIFASSSITKILIIALPFGKRQWQRDRDRRALSNLAGDGDGAPVQFDGADAQPQASAGDGADICGAVKRFEQMLEIVA